MNSASWLSSRDLAAEGVRLFCLPHAGSGAAGFYRWKRLLPPDIAVCPVLLPGREARLAESPRTRVALVIEELLQCSADALYRPYAIFGHSMGALLAFEWARRIGEAGLPSPQVLFVSGRNAPQVEPSHRLLHQLADEPFTAELKRRYGGEPDALLQDPELRAIFLPTLRSDLELVETFRCTPVPHLTCAVQAFAGRADASVSDAGLASWSELTSHGFRQQRFAGDHFYHFGAGQTELLHALTSRLQLVSSATLSSKLVEG